MAAGRRVLGSLHLDGDALRLIAAAQAGICVAPESPEMLAEAILELHQNSLLLDEMGAKGRDYAVQNFSLEAGVMQLSNYSREPSLIPKAYRWRDGRQYHCHPDHHHSSPVFFPPWMECNSSRMERISRSTNSRRILRMAVRCSGVKVIPARSSSSLRS